jgi:hypothetical protein
MRRQGRLASQRLSEREAREKEVPKRVDKKKNV